MADNTETLASLAQRLNEQNEMLKGTRKTILRLLEQIRATDIDTLDDLENPLFAFP